METKMKTWFDLEWSLSGSPIVDPVAEPNILWLDIETRKVPAPAGWSQKKRWQPFMVGLAASSDPGVLWAMVVSGTEAEIAEHLAEFAGYEIRYSATREFDEMVLRGRFTNARRAHSKKAGAWPNVDTADLRWKNIHKTLRPRSWTRAADVKSADVPEVWQAGYKKVVAVHCLRDVLETAMRDVDVKMSHRLKTELLARIR